MKLNKFFPLFAVIISVFMAASAFAQGSTFTHPDVDYTFKLPSDEWKITQRPSATNPNVEYVNVQKRDGHLEIRKLALPKGGQLSDLMRTEESKLRFWKGYVAGREEPFSGFLGGTVFNFEYIDSNQNMSGRFYFLKANDSTVYVLRFTGYQNKLRSARNQTDSIARTFDIKKAS